MMFEKKEILSNTAKNMQKRLKTVRKCGSMSFDICREAIRVSEGAAESLVGTAGKQTGGKA